ncbi:hypothetical protein T01_8365 [Trichinella spiralis]|uniref:Uncharacterized protein n=1 Tax=Trichinella spiralis TaxID=6334 RepID=A0A0V1BDG4_TRISP|nr:hypothetical protein T01_7570 [Trichinella spiralis]KRY35169.1 hypothetical protein T01_8365 [Trichinella spiralis]
MIVVALEHNYITGVSIAESAELAEITNTMRDSNITLIDSFIATKVVKNHCGISDIQLPGTIHVSCYHGQLSRRYSLHQFSVGLHTCGYEVNVSLSWNMLPHYLALQSTNVFSMTLANAVVCLLLLMFIFMHLRYVNGYIYVLHFHYKSRIYSSSSLSVSQYLHNSLNNVMHHEVSVCEQWVSLLFSLMTSLTSSPTLLGFRRTMLDDCSLSRNLL